MAKLFSTSGMASASARHPWRVVIVWVMLLVLAGVAASGLGDVLTTESNFLNKPESVRGDNLLEERLRGPHPITETIVIRSADATVDDAAFQQVVEKTTADLRAATDVVSSIGNYYEASAAGSANAQAMVSADRHATIVPVTLVGELEDAEKNTDEYLAIVAAHSAPGIEVRTVGDLSINDAFNSIAEKDLQQAEVLGMPIALIILVVVFGALVAAGVPIILALVAIAVSLGLTAIVGRAFELSFFVTNMITMIGLAVGIDYSLFIIERYREERRHGASKHDAIAIAGGTASKAVVFSGMTVVLALMGMFLIPTTIFRSLGAGAVIVVLVSVAATLTLIPASLSLLGDKLDWPRRRKYDEAMVARQRAYDSETIHRGFWGTITRVVMNHPVMAIALALTILLGAALPYTDINTGFAGVESLPESNVKTAYQELQRDFYVGVLTPVEIVVDGQATDPGIKTGIDTLVGKLGETGEFGPATVTTNDAGDLTLVSAPMSVDTNSEAAYATVEKLRSDIVPSSFRNTSARTYVTGMSAFNADFNSLIDDYTPIVFAFVLGLSLVLLTLAFRSIVVPIKAIVMNLLSVGAAYGLLVAVFQKGFGADLLGFQQVPTIESWLPIFLFCILFGLSMDYHVFLLSRIREHYDQTGENRESVAVGLQATAKIITGAALIMVAVFSGFASGNLVMMQQMGFGLAVAVLIDATIVRSILVPASMRLLGKWNWYMPTWLHWLPDLRVEGAESHVQPAYATVSSGDD
ncbi:MAG TPA: MMPL family transporter [Thermomicrobiales bacterium]|nr:MMPL family transporter [Thermomicrobiales bacterium]